MKVSTGKTTSTKRSSKKTEKPELAMLATCPTGGGGWCSYPFSPKQLERRLKAKSKLSEIEDMQKQVVKTTKSS